MGDSYAAQRGPIGGSRVRLVQASAFAFATCSVLAELGSANAQSSSEAPFGSDQEKAAEGYKAAVKAG